MYMRTNQNQQSGFCRTQLQISQDVRRKMNQIRYLCQGIGIRIVKMRGGRMSTLLWEILMMKKMLWRMKNVIVIVQKNKINKLH